MPSVPPGSYERLASFPTLWTAWHAYWRGKRRRPAVAAFDLDADLGVLALQRDLAAGTFTPAAYRITLVADPKVRIVAAPAGRDRVLQRALLDSIGPTYERDFIDQSAVGWGEERTPTIGGRDVGVRSSPQPTGWLGACALRAGAGAGP